MNFGPGLKAKVRSVENVRQTVRHLAVSVRRLRARCFGLGPDWVLLLTSGGSMPLMGKSNTKLPSAISSVNSWKDYSWWGEDGWCAMCVGLKLGGCSNYWQFRN